MAYPPNMNAGYGSTAKPQRPRRRRRKRRAGYFGYKVPRLPKPGDNETRRVY